ncbi:hypothetical protein ABC382_00115 [Lysinibacillus sp. 1P01SD]|uniref:hypothetical protein n=1 Tax=Lysinibacillus sp. 1P01SD TaxID=3132285 RepID=UPI00399F83F2
MELKPNLMKPYLKNYYLNLLEETILDHSIPMEERILAMDKQEECLSKIREENRIKVIKSGKLLKYQSLRVPVPLIRLEMSEYAVGNGEFSFPFFLMKWGNEGIETITFHEFPKAYKLVQAYETCFNIISEDVLVNDALISQWLDVEGYKWFHSCEDVLPTPSDWRYWRKNGNPMKKSGIISENTSKDKVRIKEMDTNTLMISIKDQRLITLPLTLVFSQVTIAGVIPVSSLKATFFPPLSKFNIDSKERKINFPSRKERVIKANFFNGVIFKVKKDKDKNKLISLIDDAFYAFQKEHKSWF